MIDPPTIPPAIESVSISPDSVNLTSIPAGTQAVQFTMSAVIPYALPGGKGAIGPVGYALFADGSSDPIASGTLLDNGIAPDQTADDGIYTGQASVDVSTLLVGKYHCEISAADIFGNSSNTYFVPVAVSQVNFPPVVSLVQAPDTIVLGGQTQQFKLMVRATDPNGQSDILRVFFNSYKPDGSPASGNPFPMYDDGGQTVLIPPDFTSGDATKGDGIYTLTVIISPTDSQGNPTSLGSYRFEFQAVDRSNAYSQKVIHFVQVRQ